ncbi:hypothetical protein Tco_1295670 [Tanacetum coccineum]
MGVWVFSGPQKTEHSVFINNMNEILDWLNTSGPKLDAFLKRYGSQEPNVVQTGEDAKNKRGKTNKGKKATTWFPQSGLG